MVDRAAKLRGQAQRYEKVAEALQDLQDLGEGIEPHTISLFDFDLPEETNTNRLRPITPELYEAMKAFVRDAHVPFSNKDLKGYLEQKFDVKPDAFNSGLRRLEDEGYIVAEVRPMGRRPGLYRSKQMNGAPTA